MKTFEVYVFESKMGVDFRIGNRRAGSLHAGTIKAEDKQAAVTQLKGLIHSAVGPTLQKLK